MASYYVLAFTPDEYDTMNHRPLLIELLAVHVSRWDKTRSFAIQSVPESIQFVASPDLIAFQRNTLTWKPVCAAPEHAIGKKPAYARVMGFSSDYETSVISKENWAAYRRYIENYAQAVITESSGRWFPKAGGRAILRSDMGCTSIIRIDQIKKGVVYFTNHTGQHFLEQKKMNVSPLPPFNQRYHT